MIIEIKSPKWFVRFAFAWQVAKLAWKDYRKYEFSRQLKKQEIQDLFEEVYNKHAPAAKEKLKNKKEYPSYVYAYGSVGNGAIR